jgi:hypothetical protein
MISQTTIKKYKLDPDSLKSLFTSAKPSDEIKLLTDLIGDRIKESRERNFSDYKIWAAVDMAYDTPFTQTTATILRHITGTCKDEKEVFNALESWGLSRDLLFSPGDEAGGAKKWHADYKSFTEVFVPLVRAYLTIRLSKIFNDRNLTPLFEYTPLFPTAENRFLCEVIEELVETVGTNFGYSSVLRDFIFNALMYSVAIKFPVEPWTVDKQENEDGEEEVEKEGVRYVIPHISRIGYDLNFPLHTLNTGTGCSYALYWTVMRWGGIDKSIYWNTDKVPHGTNWLDPNSGYHNYFTEVYPCSLQPPTARRNRKTDREDMSTTCYNKNDYDSAFFVSYIFMELVPADWGLGDYKHKVWMKFTIGSDRTVMYAEAFSYRPIDYIGYDADSGRGRNASLALEIMPFQDLTGNALTQYLLTVKRNLTNITFYNTEVVDSDQINNLNRGHNSQYSQLNFIGYDGLKMERSGADMNNVFKSVTFPYADPTPVLQSLNTIISVLERSLVVAAQEIGSSASHQQSKKEVEIANANTSNRVQYTASFVDDGVDAWKRQLVEACLSNMDGNDVMANVSTDIPGLADIVKKLGFEFADGEPAPGVKKVVVKGKLKKAHLVQLISRRADANRESDQVTAQAMFTAIGSISNSQFLSQVIDPASVVELIEVAAKLAGADDDFKFRLNQDAVLAGQVQKIIGDIQQQIKASEQSIMSAVESEVAKPAADAIAQQGQKTAVNEQHIQQLTGLLEQIQQALSASQPLPPPSVRLNQDQQLPPQAPIAPLAAPGAPPVPVPVPPVTA